mgnify:FL=1
MIERRGRMVAETNKATERLLTGLKTQLVADGVSADCVAIDWAEEGDTAKSILDAAREHKCDTIVLGRRGKSMIGQFIDGGVAEKLLRNPTGFTIWLVD